MTIPDPKTYTARLCTYAEELEEQGIQSIKSEKGWRLLINDFVFEFVKSGPKLIRELAKKLETSNAKVKELEAELKVEREAREKAELAVRQNGMVTNPMTWTYTDSGVKYTYPTTSNVTADAWGTYSFSGTSE